MDPERPRANRTGLRAPAAHYLLLAARAFNCFFWGILLLAVFAGTSTHIPLRGFNLPLWPSGLCALGAGAWFTLGLRGAHHRLRAAAWRCAGAFAMILYFLPFLFWWNSNPHNGFLATNTALLFFSGLLFLHQLGRLASELGAVIPEPALVFEGKMAAWAVVLFGIIPCSLMAVLGGIMSRSGEGSLFNSLAVIAGNINPWLLRLPLVPVSLGIVISLRARHACVLNLKKLAVGLTLAG